LVLGANVSQAELFVTTGNADAGLIALSLLRGDNRRVYTVVDSALHDPLLQTVAVVSTSARADAARALIAHVQSADGRAVMERYGFALPPIVRAPMANDS
jgi:molybdate transport system substrate-binding protein